jgi:hypothetical protein
MWQIDRMKQEPVILGEEAAAALLAVEGLKLSPDYRTRIDALRRQGFTTDQIREALIADLQTHKAA